jgi:Flp pilus assembly protein TadD
MQFPDLTRAETSAAGTKFGGRLFAILATIALVYSALAGLRTVSAFDLGWQLATGRWVAQHHYVPSVDVFSYTAQGEPWIYPVGAGLIFYAAYLLGGYSLLSWIGAAACCGTVALLLRRGSVASAGIAILAVPLIASRTGPRADMFTVVLFAAFLSLLWENYQTGRAPLWLLPVLMVAWVNLHFGFAAGLGVIGAYVAMEAAETIVNEIRRHAALQRLRRAAGWLVCAALATLVNPWGWGIYQALLRQERANALQRYFINEWASVPLNWDVVSSSLRHSGGAIYVLLAIAVMTAIIALFRLQLGAAMLLLGSTYPAVRYLRMGAVFSCVVVVVGGAVLSVAMVGLGSRIRSARAGSLVANVAVVLLAVVASLRSFDLVTNREYSRGDVANTFGAGPSWWFPQRAAEFIQRENLPGEIFNTYNEGGYLVWKLGPQRRDYIDGRDTLYGPQRIRNEELLHRSPDSPDWQQEASRYNINTIILPLGRVDGVRLLDFCNSKVWQPVYLDEVSGVFVRRTPQTEELIQRFPVDCATAPLPAQMRLGESRAEAFNTLANAASVLAALGRDPEALTATDDALAIFPHSAFLHWERGKLFFAMGRWSEAEQEYLAAIHLAPSAVTWSALGESYLKHGRISAGIDAIRHAARFSPKPYMILLDLGYIYLRFRQPDDALKAFDEAARSAPRDMKAFGNESDFRIAQGRADAWGALGDLEKATFYQEEAARIAPDASLPLQRLAHLYQLQGRVEDADRVKQRAAALAQNQNR